MIISMQCSENRFTMSKYNNICRPTIIAVALISISLLGSSCDFSTSNEDKSHKLPTHSETILLRAGLYGQNANFQTEHLYDGIAPLQYYIDDLYLGKGNEGVFKLLETLETFEEGRNIDVLNPATGYIGEMGHRPGLRDVDYKYPLVLDVDLRKRVKVELDRVRGWSDETQPKLPFTTGNQ